MIEAKGEGQSECFKCKKYGRYSLTWTRFLYRIKNDNFQHLYCYSCVLEEELSNSIQEFTNELKIKEINCLFGKMYQEYKNIKLDPVIGFTKQLLKEHEILLYDFWKLTKKYKKKGE